MMALHRSVLWKMDLELKHLTLNPVTVTVTAVFPRCTPAPKDEQ